MALVAQQAREAIALRTEGGSGGRNGARDEAWHPNAAVALKHAQRDNAAILKAVGDNADAFTNELAPILNANGRP